MSTSLHTQDSVSNQATGSGKRFSPPLVIALLCLLVVIAAAVLLLHFWPFSADSMAKRLSHDSGDHVTFTKFRETYFPHPGCIAEGVTFQRDPSSPRLTATRLVIEGSYLGLLHHYVPHMTAEGAVLSIPQGGLEKLGGGRQESGSPTTIGEINLPHSRIEIATASRGTLVFAFTDLRFQSVSRDQPLRFRATMRNPVPEGDLTLQGQAGPFHPGQSAETPVSGWYSFTNARLDPFPGIAGHLSSQGKVDGKLKAIHINGTTDSPDFLIDEVKHPIHLENKFQAVVDGTNGDVRLEQVQSTYDHTTIVSSGTITDDGKGGKTADLQMSSEKARIQDLLWLFVKADPPAVTGPIILKAHVVLPNNDEKFMKRLRIEGGFTLSDAHATSAETEKNIETLSARARGQADKVEDDQEKDKRDGTNRVDADLQPVAVTLKGDLVLEQGVAKFKALMFEVPGATSHLTGTYNVLNQRVDLHGTMHMEARLSHATTGIKSLLAKIIQPKTHKPNQPGADVGVKVTGTYGHPSFAVQPTAGGK